MIMIKCYIVSHHILEGGAKDYPCSALQTTLCLWILFIIIHYVEQMLSKPDRKRSHKSISSEYLH